ncbi:MAG: sulfatase, partial [Blastopirellula sp.]|nr:sulfatase [Blastopirellula sp.]
FETGELSLYNLAEDIGETKNLAGQEAARTQRLLSQLKSWRVSVGADPMRPNPEYVSAPKEEAGKGG